MFILNILHTIADYILSWVKMVSSCIRRNDHSD
jgi:hypothetical protein